MYSLARVLNPLHICIRTLSTKMPAPAPHVSSTAETHRFKAQPIAHYAATTCGVWGTSCEEDNRHSAITQTQEAHKRKKTAGTVQSHIRTIFL